VTGQDVAQLNHDLVALGYADRSDVDRAWDEFGWSTKAGIENLQDHLGVDQTGTLALGDYVFLPSGPSDRGESAAGWADRRARLTVLGRAAGHG
jgi:hypothetical protein